VQWAEGSFESAAGRFAFSWAGANASSGGGGAACASGVGEGGQADLACPPGLAFSSVAFASFGTPAGTCATGFTRGACDAPNSTAVTAAACLGRAWCSVAVSSADFGGDPCVGTSKVFSASLVCAPPGPGSVPGVSMRITVPANARATVRVPFAAGPAATFSVLEGGVAVFVAGAFAPGVPGVEAAELNTAADVPPGLQTVDVEVLSGDYVFTSFS